MEQDNIFFEQQELLHRNSYTKKTKVFKDTNDTKRQRKLQLQKNVAIIIADRWSVKLVQSSWIKTVVKRTQLNFESQIAICLKLCSVRVLRHIQIQSSIIITLELRTPIHYFKAPLNQFLLKAKVNHYSSLVAISGSSYPSNLCISTSQGHAHSIGSRSVSQEKQLQFNISKVEKRPHALTKRNNDI